MSAKNRHPGRELFLQAMAPLQVAQQEGYRQGLLRAAELAATNPDLGGRSIAGLIVKHADALPKPPVAE